MTETQKNNQTENTAPIVINTQYIKDFSLEIPHAPEIFREFDGTPGINLDVNVNANHMHDNFFTVSLITKMSGTIHDKPLFILDLEYSCVVSVNVPQEHVEPVLLVEVPRLLFPYARNIISSSLTNAGLPPFMINPIDFLAMYNARKQETKQ